MPLLHRALPHIGHFQIRNRGTVGGSTAHADPASELPAVAVALDAELVAVGAGGPAHHPGRGLLRVDLDDRTGRRRAPHRDPVSRSGTDRSGFAVEEFARRSGDFAIAGVACGVALDEDDRIARAAIALFGMGPTPLRAAGGRGGAGRFSPPPSVDLAGRWRSPPSTTPIPPTTCTATLAFARRVAAHLTRAGPDAAPSRRRRMPDREITVTVTAAPRPPRSRTAHARRLPARGLRPHRHPPRRASTACAVPAPSCSTAPPSARACCSRSRPRARRSRRSRASPPTDGSLSPVQQAFADHHGLQCGFCTPGFVVSVTRVPAGQPGADGRGDPSTRSPATCAAAPATRGSSTR